MIDTEEIMWQYIDTALWSSSCNGTANHDECRGEDCDTSLQSAGYTHSDLSDQAKREIRAQIDDYVDLLCSMRVDLGQWIADHAGSFGHDFWLTRNGHGAGFWDRGYGELGDFLATWAKTFGEANLTVGDDGRVYHD